MTAANNRMAYEDKTTAVGAITNHVLHKTAAIGAIANHVLRLSAVAEPPVRHADGNRHLTRVAVFFERDPWSCQTGRLWACRWRGGRDHRYLGVLTAAGQVSARDI